MDIKGTYQLKKAFTGFDDDFNVKYISREDALKVSLEEDSDDGLIMAAIYSRTVVEVTDKNIFIKFDTEFDDLAKKIADANGMAPNDGKYYVMKYNVKKTKDNKFKVTSEDGEDSGEVEFTNDEFELMFNVYERI